MDYKVHHFDFRDDFVKNIIRDNFQDIKSELLRFDEKEGRMREDEKSEEFTLNKHFVRKDQILHFRKAFDGLKSLKKYDRHRLDNLLAEKTLCARLREQTYENTDVDAIRMNGLDS